MAQHPLEPLSADEFRRTNEILRREGHVTGTFRFASIELMEPAKQDVLAWRAGDALPRHSFAVVWNRADNKTYEATVDLTGDAVLSFKLTGRVGGGVELKVHRPHPIRRISHQGVGGGGRADAFAAAALRHPQTLLAPQSLQALVVDIAAVGAGSVAKPPAGMLFGPLAQPFP